MHNSQNAAPLVNPTQNNLMTKDCVGCHSSDSNDTIVTINGSRIPIVYNTGGYPSSPLAGGNFFHVAKNGSALNNYGHNVHGISDADSDLTATPGNVILCGASCHETLADATTWDWYGTNGCTGCHQAYKHHGIDPADGDPETAASGWFRFLGGHKGALATYYVEGIEDPDWEQTADAVNHNLYKGTADWYGGYDALESQHTITAFCRGCHMHFHNSTGGATDNIGPWLRHPTDLALPETGEYGAYDPVSAYDPQVPVAWVNPSLPDRAEAVVMCLSCHRAHGSEHPDMLRWDYSTMITGGGATGTGCFKCHSNKD